MTWDCQFIIAADSIPAPFNALQSPPSPMAQWAFGDVAIVVAAALAVGILAVIAAVFFRSPKRRSRHHSKTVTDSTSRDSLVLREVVDRSGGRRKIRYRRRRRDHRPRNPTLAETGGLPPAREDDK
jgi:hypothetical protein